LVEQENLALEESTNRMKHDNDHLEEQVRQLEALATRREAFAARLEEQMAQVNPDQGIMADNLQKRTPQDRDQINQHEEWEMEYWTKELGVTQQQLKDAIAVDKELRLEKERILATV